MSRQVLQLSNEYMQAKNANLQCSIASANRLSIRRQQSLLPPAIKVIATQDGGRYERARTLDAVAIKQRQPTKAHDLVQEKHQLHRRPRLEGVASHLLSTEKTAGKSTQRDVAERAYYGDTAASTHRI